MWSLRPKKILIDFVKTGCPKFQEKLSQGRLKARPCSLQQFSQLYPVYPSYSTCTALVYSVIRHLLSYLLFIASWLQQTGTIYKVLQCLGPSFPPQAPAAFEATTAETRGHQSHFPVIPTELIKYYHSI